ncbi:hypothetical protein IQ227_20450 [Anabaena aphanizomenioides LEGE 00250]|uniref:Uncharacterized protein n=1 Tax=Sphaerospermopsis aphanizomenoides LEGE 00250 TaxID=2777972 RepID=A0ABR9VIK1_9CYAN|nr:hypothetical protein [Sphaerospermopsis aphanizomenoides]MBE9238326.1 hypothetical protein [Sphaerospermopsis aphanizomenoides LEGE 00250]
MGGIYEVLQKIKHRPGMYIGNSSITILRHFLVGYKFARNELGVELNQEESDFYENFQPWIQQHFNVRTSNSWANIILLFTRDEKDAFNRFFTLLEEFKQRDQNQDNKAMQKDFDHEKLVSKL